MDEKKDDKKLLNEVEKNLDNTKKFYDKLKPSLLGMGINTSFIDKLINKVDSEIQKKKEKGS
jgi:hypothetical protein